MSHDGFQEVITTTTTTTHYQLLPTITTNYYPLLLLLKLNVKSQIPFVICFKNKSKRWFLRRFIQILGQNGVRCHTIIDAKEKE